MRVWMFLLIMLAFIAEHGYIGYMMYSDAYIHPCLRTVAVPYIYKGRDHIRYECVERQK